MMRDEKEGMMKRVGLIAGMLVIAFGAMWFANPGGAQDDAVPVLQTQVADLQTRVAALEAESATPGVTVVASSGAAFALDGNGITVTDPIELGENPYRTSFTCSNSIKGFVTVYSSAGVKGSFGTGHEVLDLLHGGTFTLEVTCTGAWSLSIEPVAP